MELSTCRLLESEGAAKVGIRIVWIKVRKYIPELKWIMILGSLLNEQNLRRNRMVELTSEDWIATSVRAHCVVMHGKDSSFALRLYLFNFIQDPKHLCKVPS